MYQPSAHYIDTGFSKECVNNRGNSAVSIRIQIRILQLYKRFQIGCFILYCERRDRRRLHRGRCVRLESLRRV